ncbi:glycosyltransferase [Rufibacter sediminis]|uniref:Glycosyltransferase n=1 Tax=Rufibacter sediminis TaxID=2762756 RepID=A0ABR6VMU4_9BACT|nr:glycosyltransferase [Rufibacter sediminis]MBC3538503.1 glycosyltransferase [Rufibacter sediminis]
MKILHFCDQFSPLSETFIYDLIVQLEETGVENTIVTNKRLNENERPFDKVVEVPKYKKNLVERFVYKLQVVSRLKSNVAIEWGIVRNAIADQHLVEKADVIHAHYGPQGCAILPLAQAFNKPLVVSFHGFDAFQISKDPFWFRQLHILFQGASIITVVSKMMREHLITLGCPASKLRVIHVGKQINNYAFKPPVDKKIRDFISVGRMVEKKGHIDGVKAIEQLLNKYPDLSLKIIGDGPLLEEVRLYVEQHALKSHVHILGSVSHAETKRQFYEADAFLLCSKTASNGDMEGVPTVLMEAQFLGLPCVSTKHSGIPEVIPENNQWLLANEGDVDSISKAIEALLNAPYEVVHTAAVEARRKVEVEFDQFKEAEKLKEIYLNIRK